MKKSMKKSNKLRYTALATLLTLGLNPVATTIHAESSSDYSVNYIEGDEEAEEHSENSQVRDTAGKTQEEINDAEGIAAEQIVVKISEEGYVTSHGDHYHYYNGQVPHNSFISESLLTDDSYQFQEADIVSELEDGGYVVLVDGEYKVFYEDVATAKKVRTIDELVLQSHGIDPKDAANIVALRQELNLDETAMIIYELEKDLAEIVKEADAQRDPAVVYVTEKEMVYLVGTDLYVMPGEMSEDVKIYDQVLAPSDYELGDQDIVRDIPGGHVVKIEDKHYLYFTEGVPANRVVAKEDLVEAVKEVSEMLEETGQDKERQAKKDAASAGAVLGAGVRDGSGRLVAEDGYVFSPYDVIRDAGSGFIVPHGDHFHFIPKSQLTPQELEIANKVLDQGGQGQASQSGQSTQGNAGQSGSNQAQGNQPGQSGNIIQDAPKGGRRYHSNKPYTTDDGYVFTADSIVSADQAGLITAHHDHFHYVPFADLNKQELQAAQNYLRTHLGINRNLVAEFAPSNPAPQPMPQPVPQPEVKPEQGNKPGNADKPEGEQKPETQPESNKPEKPQTPEKSALQKALDKLYGLPKSERHVEGDGLVFDPMEISRVIQVGNERGFVIPHGDHFHVIKESQLTEFEREVTDLVLVEKGLQEPVPQPESKPEIEKPAQKPEAKPETKPEAEKPETEPETKPEVEKPAPQPEAKPEAEKPAPQPENNPDSDNKKVDSLAMNIEKVAKGKDGKPYTTSDGYTFTPESILSYDEFGIVAKHDDHTHYIPLNELEDSELQAAADFINGSDSNVQETKPAEGTPEEIERKLNYVAALVGLSKDELKMTGNLVIVPHGDHTHTMDLADVPLYLEADQFDSKHAYQDHLLALKVNQTKLANPNSQVIRDGDEVVVTDASGKEERLNLNDIELPFEYESIDFSNLKRPEPTEEELERQRQREEAAKKAAEEAEQKAEKEAQQASVPEMTAFLANHYGIEADNILYFSDMFVIPSQNPDDANISIHRDLVDQAMKGDLSILPVMENESVEEVPAEETTHQEGVKPVEEELPSVAEESTVPVEELAEELEPSTEPVE